MEFCVYLNIFMTSCRVVITNSEKSSSPVPIDGTKREVGLGWAQECVPRIGSEVSNTLLPPLIGSLKFHIDYSLNQFARKQLVTQGVRVYVCEATHNAPRLSYTYQWPLISIRAYELRRYSATDFHYKESTTDIRQSRDWDLVQSVHRFKQTRFRVTNVRRSSNAGWWTRYGFNFGIKWP